MEFMNEFFSAMNWSAIANIATLIGTATAVISSIKSMKTEISSRIDSVETRIDLRCAEDRARSDAKFLAIENRIDTLYQMFVDLLKDKKKGK